MTRTKRQTAGRALAYTLLAHKPVTDVAATAKVVPGGMVAIQQVVVCDGDNVRMIVFVQAGFVDKIIGNSLPIQVPAHDSVDVTG